MIGEKKLASSYLKKWLSNGFFFRAKAGQKAGFRVMLKCFEIKKGFSLLYKTNRFHVAVRLFSNRSQMTSKSGKNISDASSPIFVLFLPQRGDLLRKAITSLQRSSCYLISVIFF